jgi:hypothetical protein
LRVFLKCRRIFGLKSTSTARRRQARSYSKITTAELATSAIWGRHSTASCSGDLETGPTWEPSRPGSYNSQPPRRKGARKSRQRQSSAALSPWSPQRSFATRPSARPSGAPGECAHRDKRQLFGQCPYRGVFEAGHFPPAPVDRPWPRSEDTPGVRWEKSMSGACGRAFPAGGEIVLKIARSIVRRHW